MGRFLGQLYLSIIDGKKISHSYAQFRRRKSQASCYRKVACGADVVKCGGADPCGGKAEPYVNIFVVDGGGNKYKVGRTKTVFPTNDPVWNEQLVTVIDTEDRAYVAIKEVTKPFIQLQVMDDDGGGDHFYADDLIGEAVLPLEDVMLASPRADVETPRDFTLPVTHPRDRDSARAESSIRVRVWWEDMGSYDGVAVPGTYFRRTRGNMVRLYHDAHCEAGDFENIRLQGPLQNLMFSAQNCWEDIYHDLNNAQEVILMCGWSVNTALSLVRNDSTCGETIGELLLRKAEEGLTICVMVWDDVTSLSNLAMAKDGLMGTYDEYTRQFFEGTQVQCVLSKRVAGDDQGIMIGPMWSPLKGSSFTHHQKIVVCDVDAVQGLRGKGSYKNSDQPKRCLAAYVGGLDLTSGRYDTSRHQLFKTLTCEHEKDFYNGCCAEVDSTHGPREPWHDIHSRIQGPGAWDVCENFLERLQSQQQICSTTNKCTGCNQCKAYRLASTRLAHTVKNNKITSKTACGVSTADVNVWSVQVLRSIDTMNAVLNSAFAARYNDPTGLMTDKSIQAAYLYNIDRSKRYIYIENQYFLGSSQYWLSRSVQSDPSSGDGQYSGNEVLSPHLVPYALMKRIARAIARNEDYCVYIMTPLFPEGIPTSMSVQEILQWQFLTMQMMYYHVQQKLREYQSNKECTDYLQFWFPAKIEKNPCFPNNPYPKSTVCEGTVAKFQIYVHSKMMIVDDEYAIIGSANINERSMAGGRDSEIAVGLSQEYLRCTINLEADKPILPKGDIYGFRMQLWQEQFGCIKPEFEDPGIPECARLTKTMTTANLDALYSIQSDAAPYTTYDVHADNQGNLSLPYGYACKHPTEYDSNGILKPHSKYINIINSTAPVIGARSAFLPAPLTT
ncbi:phospholipase D [Gregarina niphandrodes]|uniref:phospholipase D n=1 Tax=Gregarina niphandrodes TaxID=110365 RepID=A0A023B9N1_GRENI|nr:phospholipase D [Gregarina niphandrodes]EZG73001.1 phospholipase D [Gregarina niphandrodes]|eukprot:XP_011129696.1 phospholipase D [Gregarina niphandrodes]